MQQSKISKFSSFLNESLILKHNSLTLSSILAIAVTVPNVTFRYLRILFKSLTLTLEPPIESLDRVNYFTKFSNFPTKGVILDMRRHFSNICTPNIILAGVQ